MDQNKSSLPEPEGRVALVTGFTGQDGTFLTKHLIDKGYQVVALVRRISTEPPRRVRGKFDFSEAIGKNRLILVDGDLQSISSLIKILKDHRPREIYNLAWQSHVGLSFKIPEVSNQDYQGFVNLITAVESIKQARDYDGELWEPRIYQASTSEMFGDVEPTEGGLQFMMTENNRLNPNSPYAIAKAAAHFYGASKRKQGLFVSSGILFNHESEIRGGDFVTQKIVRGAVEWQYDGKPIELGNLSAMRDWGYAGDYVKAMHMILQAEQPDDFIIATGTTRMITQFVESAFKALGFTITWEGLGLDTIGRVDGKVAVRVNKEFYRPNEVGYLCGQATKAKEILGWEPETSFDDMVKIMIDAELARVRGE
jgi:GDPmannose 4,6-dehydratase